MSHYLCEICREPITETPWGVMSGCRHHPPDFPRNRTQEGAARRLAELALKHCPKGHADRREAVELAAEFGALPP